VFLGVVLGAVCASVVLGLWAKGRLKSGRERAAELEKERQTLLVQVETLRATLGVAEQDRARFETRAERVSELERTLEKREETLETIQREARSLGEGAARLRAELEQVRRDAAERRDMLAARQQEAASLQNEVKALAEDKARLATALDEQGRALAEKTQLLESRETVLDTVQAELTELGKETAGLRVELDQERSAAAEKLELVSRAEQRLREAFQALSAEALKSNNQAFLELARAQLGEFQQGAKSDLEERQRVIGQLVSPIEQSLDKVQGVIQGIEKERAAAYGELREQVKGLAAAQQQLHSETANLVKALRSPSIRGRWGEIQLRRVVEMAGMLDHCDFFEQESKDTEAGRLRPDLIVRLPGGRQVVVDSKVPLAAYLSSVEAADDSARETLLEEHGRQVRVHMAKLASKGYWEQFEPTPDFVVMFLPGETFFSAALQKDPGSSSTGSSSG